MWHRLSMGPNSGAICCLDPLPQLSFTPPLCLFSKISIALGVRRGVWAAGPAYSFLSEDSRPGIVWGRAHCFNYPTLLHMFLIDDLNALGAQRRVAVARPAYSGYACREAQGPGLYRATPSRRFREKIPPSRATVVAVLVVAGLQCSWLL